MHKQHIFTGKELKFLFQPAFRDYIGHVASECSCQNSRRSFHSVHWPFPFVFRGIPFAHDSSVFPLSFSTLSRFFFLPFLSRFANCDFWHASYSWVGRVKPDPWEASAQNIKFNLTNSINPTNEVGTQNVLLTFVTYIPVLLRSFSSFFPPLFSVLF